MIFLNKIESHMPVGGKARALGELVRMGFRVPNAFVVLPGSELEEAELLHAFDKLGSEHVAVRSSAINEDGEKAAWAGQLETKLNVTRDGLFAAIQACRDSAGSDRALAYAQAHGQESGGVAVIVQRMLASDISGVAFSKHPVTGEDAVVIEAVKGLGEKLVGGQVTPDTYVIQEPFVVRERHLAADGPKLDDARLQEVATLTGSIAERFGYPIDIEWVYENDILYAMQARPITTL